MTGKQSFFVTGATGLIGRRMVAALLADERVERVFALVRDPRKLGAIHGIGSGSGVLKSSHMVDSSRLVPVRGDLRLDGLGIDRGTHDYLARETTGVIHAAADTSFSQTLEHARAINRDATLQLIKLSAEWSRVSRWVYVSTAFVQGDRTGLIPDDDGPAHGGWLNAYEQSKAEAERMVCSRRADWVIARPSTIVCDDRTGAISQVNAVHRALRLYFSGLASMVPSADGSTLDVVTAEYVSNGIACLALAPGLERQAFHLCAGRGALPLDELIDVTHEAFSRSVAWRRRGIARPARADLATYRIFEQAVEDVASERVKQAVRSLSFFVPQLAFPKSFCTSRTDALLGQPAPIVREFWTNMVTNLAGGAEEMVA